MTILDLNLQSLTLSSNNAQTQLETMRLPNDVRGAKRLVTSQAESLSGVLSRHGNPNVDFLSLDVEGYELEVLRGLDLQTHRLNTFSLKRSRSTLFSIIWGITTSCEKRVVPTTICLSEMIDLLKCLSRHDTSD